MLKWEYEILDPEGLHARPASKLVMTSIKYQSEIRILCGGKNADAGNILEVMALGVRRKDKITIEVSGSDEEAALEAVKRTLVQNDDLNPHGGYK